MYLAIGVNKEWFVVRLVPLSIYRTKQAPVARKQKYRQRVGGCKELFKCGHYVRFFMSCGK
jgi:hypothetical protein